jgi:phosphatidylinositol kinase/protein kinase (PI-3  family)
MAKRKKIEPKQPAPDMEKKEFWTHTFLDLRRQRDVAFYAGSYQAAARFQSQMTAAYNEIPKDEEFSDLGELTDEQLVAHFIETVEILPLSAVQDIFVAIADRLNYQLAPRLVSNE